MPESIPDMRFRSKKRIPTHTDINEIISPISMSLKETEKNINTLLIFIEMGHCFTDLTPVHED